MWMNHLSESDRRGALALVQKCLVAFSNAGSELLHGRDRLQSHAVMREAVEVDGRMRAVQFVHSVQTVHAAETLALIVTEKADGGGMPIFRLRYYPRAGDPIDLASRPGLAIDVLTHWRDRLSATPDEAMVGSWRNLIGEVTALAQMAASNYGVSWERGLLLDGPRGFELMLDLEPVNHQQERLVFAGRDPTWRRAGMTSDLAATFAALLSRNMHVTAQEEDLRDETFDVSVGPAPCVFFHRPTDALAMVRALSRLPKLSDSAALLPPKP